MAIIAFTIRLIEIPNKISIKGSITSETKIMSAKTLRIFINLNPGSIFPLSFNLLFLFRKGCKLLYRPASQMPKRIQFVMPSSVIRYAHKSKSENRNQREFFRQTQKQHQAQKRKINDHRNFVHKRIKIRFAFTPDSD